MDTYKLAYTLCACCNIYSYILPHLQNKSAFIFLAYICSEYLILDLRNFSLPQARFCPLPVPCRDTGSGLHDGPAAHRMGLTAHKVCATVYYNKYGDLIYSTDHTITYWQMRLPDKPAIGRRQAATKPQGGSGCQTRYQDS